MRYDGPGFVQSLGGRLVLEDVHAVISDEDVAAFYTRRHAWHGTIESRSADLITVFSDVSEFRLGIPGHARLVARVVSFDLGGVRAQVVGDEPLG
jgi:hypothetical protein